MNSDGNEKPEFLSYRLALPLVPLFRFCLRLRVLLKIWQGARRVNTMHTWRLFAKAALFMFYFHLLRYRLYNPSSVL